MARTTRQVRRLTLPSPPHGGEESRRHLRTSAGRPRRRSMAPESRRRPTPGTLREQEESMPDHKIVSRDEWIVARTEHLAREKEFTRLRDQLSRERRELPWVRVDKTYVFDGPGGPE